MGVQVPPFAPTFLSTLTQHPTQYPEKTKSMSQPTSDQPEFKLTKAENYRDTYANSVQVRLSVWDFHLIFGTVEQSSPTEVQVLNSQGVYLSPQQAKALWNVLGQNLAQYEQTFGKLALEPVPPAASRPVN